MLTDTRYRIASPTCGEESSTIFVTVRSAEPTTSPIVVVWLAASFVRSVFPMPDTVAEFVTVPDGVPAGTETCTVTVHVVPAVSGSIEHTIAFPVTTHVPAPDDVAPVTESADGTVSVSATDLASSGPAFVTAMSYENGSPGITGSAESVLTTERSAAIGVTVSASVAVSLAGLGSGTGEDVMAAVFTSVAEGNAASIASVSW